MARQTALFEPRPSRPGVKKTRAVKAPTRSLAPAGLPVMTAELATLTGDITEHLSGPRKRGPGWWYTPSSIPHVVAVDVGAMTAVAHIDPSGNVDVEALARDMQPVGAEWCQRIGAQLAHVVKLGRDDGKRAIVVVEEAFLHPTTPNVQSTLSLERRVGAVIALACVCGAPVWRVRPSEWQHRIIGRLSRDAGKARSIDVARERTGLPIESDHEADACLLAMFARGMWARINKAKAG